MARRSSYETYKQYYLQYTKGGRKASAMLTPEQFEVAKRDYYKSGQNIARRIASDAMELSNKQLRSAGRLMRELDRAEAVKKAAQTAVFGTDIPTVGKSQKEKYATEQKRTISEETRAIEKAKQTLSSARATFDQKEKAKTRIENAQKRIEAAKSALSSLENLQDVNKRFSGDSSKLASTARELYRDEFKKKIERLKELGYSHYGISELLGSPEETPV